MPRKGSIRVVIIEDSRLLAGQMERIFKRDPRLEVVGIAHRGGEGRRMVRRLKPDVVSLDVHMPGMDGLTCLQYIMAEQPTPCVMVSALTGESAIETYEAFELGAVDVIQKPAADDPTAVGQFERRLVAKAVRASYADPANLRRYTPPEERPPAQDKQRPARPHAVPTVARELVVMGASTGGPRAVMEVLGRLPPDQQASVLVVQHMPGSFTPSFARRLDEICALRVSEARAGERLEARRVYLAPGDYHLTLHAPGAGTGATIVLSRNADGEFVVPSVNRAMSSAVEIFGERMVGVILTGIGNDGADAMAQVREAGGVTIAESELSATIYGMPRAVVERGLADHVLPVRKIAEAIIEALSGLEAAK